MFRFVLQFGIPDNIRESGRFTSAFCILVNTIPKSTMFLHPDPGFFLGYGYIIHGNRHIIDTLI